MAIMLLFAVPLPGCSNDKVDHAPPSPVIGRTTFLIGLVPEESMFRQVERYQPLSEFLSKRTGFDVRLIVLPRYESMLTSFGSERMDAAFFGSFTYMLAHEKLGVRAVARPERVNGRSSYHGLIFVRKDSRIRSVRDMRGKRFVFVSKDTTAGFLLPFAYFKRAGINYKTYLGDTYFAGTHEDTIYDVLDGKADIGAAKNTEFERLADADPRIRDELLVLEGSPEFPENTFAVRKDLDGKVTEAVKSALLHMHQDAEGAQILKEFGARRFIETSDADFLPLYEYVRSVGLTR